MTIPCSNTPFGVTPNSVTTEDKSDTIGIGMFYDESPEPQDLSQWMDHEIAQMRPEKGLARAAINEVLKLRQLLAKKDGDGR